MLIVLAMLSAPVQAASWRSASSEHFHIYTDLAADDARQLALDLEYFHLVLGYLSHDTQAAATPPVEIWAFARQRDFDRTTKSRDVAGYYSSGPHGGRAALYSPVEDRWEKPGREVLLHEYTHHFMRRSPYRYPAWYEEGFAEYLSTFTLENDLAILGRPPLWRLWVLDEFRWISSETLIVDGMRYLSKNWPSRMMRANRKKAPPQQMLYALGWFAAHYLHSDAARTALLADFIERLNRGEAPKAAFSAAFGMSFRDMDEQLRDYWADGRIPFRGLRLPTGDAMAPVAVRELPIDRTAFWIAETQMSFGYHPKPEKMAREFERALESLGPDDVDMRLRVLLDLAELANDEGELERAADYTQKALELRPGDPRALHHRARTLLMLATASYRNSGAASPQAALERGNTLVTSMRALVERGLEEHPDDPALLAHLVKSYIFDDRADATPGIRALGRLQRVYPQHDSIQFYAALLYAEANRHERALESIDFAASFTRTEGQANGLANLRSLVLEHREAAGSGALPVRRFVLD